MPPIQHYAAESHIWFLADIHLSEQRADISKTFQDTLTKLARQRPTAVYILGDLFDYWLGDDCISAYQHGIAHTIHALAQICPVYYQHGNRDFLIGEDFAARAGMQLLPERQIITLGTMRVLLEHGDLLCTDDIGYQRLRRVVHHRYTQAVWRNLSKSLKQRIATRLRQESKQRGARKDSVITDVNAEAVEHALQAAQCDVLIHGHTHRCNTHQHHQGIRYVLGDWRPWGMMLRYTNKKFTFICTDRL